MRVNDGGGCTCSPAPPQSIGAKVSILRATTSSTALRASPTSSPITSPLSAIGRSNLAGRPRWLRKPAPLHRPFLRLFGLAGKTSCRRVLRLGREQSEVLVSPTKSAARPTRDTWARPWRSWFEGEEFGFITSPGEGNARGTSSPRRSSTRPAVQCQSCRQPPRCWPQCPPVPAYSVSRQASARRNRASTLRKGLAHTFCENARGGR